MKKIVIVSDSFKGTLESKEICAIARRVIPDIIPGCSAVCIPAADGGEGTVDAFVSALGAKRITCSVRGAYGVKDGAVSCEPDVSADYAMAGNTAVIEMAAAAGLPSVEGRRNPEITTTYGVGQLISDALKRGAKHILLGLGGSATNDGGCGMAASLGTVFTDKEGKSFIPTGGTLCGIAAIDNSRVLREISGVDITVMCDVTNPMYGENGAAYIFAPQKGADSDMVVRLDRSLRHLSALMERDLGVSVSSVPGSGAAGAMGAGCMAFLGANLRSGIEAVLDAADFDRALDGADLVITGEGRFDAQSLSGKVISGVTSRAAGKGIPVIAIVGAVGKDLISAGILQALDRTYADGLPIYAVPALGIRAVYSTNIGRLSYAEILASGRTPADYEQVLATALENAENLQ
ncbi:MAG: glycerate kinase [Lachnospiraceae bacterium]|nr:glycerate kinase [Lachnospiraceae bacterium]